LNSLWPWLFLDLLKWQPKPRVGLLLFPTVF